MKILLLLSVLLLTARFTSGNHEEIQIGCHAEFNTFSHQNGAHALICYEHGGERMASIQMLVSQARHSANEISVCGPSESNLTSCCSWDHGHAVFIPVHFEFGVYLTENGVEQILTPEIIYVLGDFARDRTFFENEENSDYCPPFEEYSRRTNEISGSEPYQTLELNYDFCEEACSNDTQCVAFSVERKVVGSSFQWRWLECNLYAVHVDEVAFQWGSCLYDTQEVTAVSPEIIEGLPNTVLKADEYITIEPRFSASTYHLRPETEYYIAYTDHWTCGNRSIFEIPSLTRVDKTRTASYNCTVEDLTKYSLECNEGCINGTCVHGTQCDLLCLEDKICITEQCDSKAECYNSYWRLVEGDESPICAEELHCNEPASSENLYYAFELQEEQKIIATTNWCDDDGNFTSECVGEHGCTEVSVDGERFHECDLEAGSYYMNSFASRVVISCEDTNGTEESLNTETSDAVTFTVFVNTFICLLNALR